MCEVLKGILAEWKNPVFSKQFCRLGQSLIVCDIAGHSKST